MEGSCPARTAQLVGRDASGGEPERRLPRARRLTSATALIYSTWSYGLVSLLPERPLVLLVEDDREGRILFAEWLDQAGFRVEQVHNGLQALERAFDLIPDAIVTDLNIPGIDGYELTRRLKSDPRTEHIPILAVTGYA